MADVRTWNSNTLGDLKKAMRNRRQKQGRALRIVGIVLIIAALAVGAYVWWLLWGTGYTTRHAQAQLRPGFEKIVGTRPATEAPKDPRTVNVPGKAVMIIRIPVIHVNYVVVEGTDTEDLMKGPGHYSGTAYPWQNHGRVGIAGHRTTYGAPFWSLDEVKEGDRIELETEYGIFNYRVTDTRIINPSNGSVLSPTERPSLVLTTCNPRFSAAERLVVFADRVNAPATTGATGASGPSGS
jgi:sortase A